MRKGYVETNMFSKSYRKMIADLKKFIKQDAREEEQLYDIRTSEGAGRKGSASRPSSVPQSRQPRRNSGTKSGPADNETKKDSDAGTASADDAAI
ncbi:hypothetical protein LCGC14_3025530 [marine sediment metagenome]|uniref:Uncharacterized protein n=1 Tax=marine sediment metagenome TaxID=412755 RepID=A0A0F8XH31_9ZZZZ